MKLGTHLFYTFVDVSRQKHFVQVQLTFGGLYIGNYLVDKIEVLP